MDAPLLITRDSVLVVVRLYIPSRDGPHAVVRNTLCLASSVSCNCQQVSRWNVARLVAESSVFRVLRYTQDVKWLITMITRHIISIEICHFDHVLLMTLKCDTFTIAKHAITITRGLVSPSQFHDSRQYLHRG